MVRVGTVTKGEWDDVSKYHNALVADYLSQTDTNDQNIASDLVFASGKAPKYDGSPKTRVSVTVSGSGPKITYAHGKGSAPDGCSPGAKAPQPYAIGWTADATNIYIHVSAAGPVTVSIDAWWD